MERHTCKVLCQQEMFFHKLQRKGQVHWFTGIDPIAVAGSTLCVNSNYLQVKTDLLHHIQPQVHMDFAVCGNKLRWSIAELLTKHFGRVSDILLQSNLQDLESKENHFRVPHG